MLRSAVEPGKTTHVQPTMLLPPFHLNNPDIPKYTTTLLSAAQPTGLYQVHMTAYMYVYVRYCPAHLGFCFFAQLTGRLHAAHLVRGHFRRCPGICRHHILPPCVPSFGRSMTQIRCRKCLACLTTYPGCLIILSRNRAFPEGFTQWIFCPLENYLSVSPSSSVVITGARQTRPHTPKVKH